MGNKAESEEEDYEESKEFQIKGANDKSKEAYDEFASSSNYEESNQEFQIKGDKVSEKGGFDQSDNDFDEYEDSQVS